MADMVTRLVQLFVEDHAHEIFTRALVKKIAREHGIIAQVEAANAKGGRAVAIKKLDLFQRQRKRQAAAGVPHLLVVVIDSNCRKPQATRREIESVLDTSLFPAVAVGCPNPHIERWYLAHPSSFARVVGASPRIPRYKCKRDIYKQALSNSVAAAGQMSAEGGIDFGIELVEAMDLYEAAKSLSCLGAFIRDLSAGLEQIKLISS